MEPPAKPHLRARDHAGRRAVAASSVAASSFVGGSRSDPAHRSGRSTPPPHRETAIPRWIKLAYTAFVLVMVPYYGCVLGPVNFLYYCDFALLLGLPAVWLDSRLLVSTVMVGILVPQSLWILDFVGESLGMHWIGIAGYMFRDDLPQLARGLSTFHFWQLLLFLGLTRRLGYDRRAAAVWAGLAWGLMLICYHVVPAAYNINFVYGLNAAGSQSYVSATAYFLTYMAVFPLLVIGPAHLLLRSNVFSARSGGRHVAAAGVNEWESNSHEFTATPRPVSM